MRKLLLILLSLFIVVSAFGATTINPLIASPKAPDHSSLSSNLKLWLKSDTGLFTDSGCTIAVSSDGDAVGCWQGQSSNGYSFTQATAGDQPSYENAAGDLVNGHPVIDFANDSLGTSSTFSNQQGTVFIVWDSDGQSGVTQRVLLSQAEDTLFANYLIFAHNMINNQRPGIRQRETDTEDLLEIQSDITLNIPYISAFTGNGSRYKVYLQGKEETLTVHTGADNGDWFGDVTSNNITVGALDDGTAGTTKWAANGQIMEIIVYDTELSTQDHKFITQYLVNRYALTAAAQAMVTIGFSSCDYGPQSGLVLCMDMDAADIDWSVAPPTIQDNSTLSNDGTIENGALAVSGKVGQALDFDGTDDYIDLGDPADGSLDFGTSTDFTITAWVKINDDATDNHRIVEKRQVFQGYNIHYDDIPSALRAVIDGGASGNCVVDATTDIEDGLWHYTVAVFYRRASCTTDDILIYLDNILESTSAASGSGGTTDVDVSTAFSARIGTRVNEDKLMNGIIDEVRIYNRALSRIEITGLFELGMVTISP